jgi:DNA-directed RNA polymerase subunit RPC12/RpoP
MPVCAVCGNDYDKTIVVTQGQRSMTFDSFECAIEGMAPRCAHCGLRVVGHGVEKGDQIFCCAHCAKQFGASEMKDRVA